jgi:magnesium chelatase family protein
VRAALVNSGFEFPAGRITVNLAPADLPKDGGRFDLAIAVGIVIASGQVASCRDLTRLEFLGELGLAGDLRGVRRLAGRAGCLALGHRRRRPRPTPTICAGHRRWRPPLPTTCSPCAPGSRAGSSAADIDFESIAPPTAADLPQLADICGQPQGKLALEVAAAGGHSLLLIGPPGCGKTMLAERLRGLLPPLEAEEAREVAMIASLASATVPRLLGRPFRAPTTPPPPTPSSAAVPAPVPARSPSRIGRHPVPR